MLKLNNPYLYFIINS